MISVSRFYTSPKCQGNPCSMAVAMSIVFKKHGIISLILFHHMTPERITLVPVF
jgi:hypothetical protein